MAEDEKKSIKMEEEKIVKVDEKKVPKKVEPKVRDVAIARGVSMRISPKQAVAICKVIKGKSPVVAIKRLEAVIAEKRVIPMAGLEVAHQRGKGIAGAKYPKNACKEIIGIVKQAEANATISGIENPIIFIAKSDRASAPFRRNGRKAKRTHIYIEVKNKVEKAKK